MDEGYIAILILIVYFSPIFYQLAIVIKESKRGNPIPLQKLKSFLKYSLSFAFFALILCGVLNHTNFLDYEKPMTFDQYDSITFENFRGFEFFKKKLYGNERFAYVVTTIESDILDNSVRLESYFHPSRSFVYKNNIDSEHLLTHEKYHIKITELFVRKAKQKISRLDKFDKFTIEKIIRSSKMKEKKYQRDYDYHTFHSYVFKEQKNMKKK